MNEIKVLPFADLAHNDKLNLLVNQFNEVLSNIKVEFEGLPKPVVPTPTPTPEPVPPPEVSTSGDVLTVLAKLGLIKVDEKGNPLLDANGKPSLV